jgi:hypothetical protein
MVIASAGLIFWFIAIMLRDAIIKHHFERAEPGPADAVKTYSRLGLRYGDIAVATLLVTLLLVLTTAAFTNSFGWGKGRADAVKVDAREAARLKEAELDAIEERQAPATTAAQPAASAPDKFPADQHPGIHAAPTGESSPIGGSGQTHRSLP